MLALLALVAVVAIGWALVTLLSAVRARKAQSATQGRFEDYLLHALVNAAKIDGRIHETERAAIAQSLAAAGAPAEPAALDAAFAEAKLSKAELVAYLTARAGHFTQAQKMTLLKALMAVFVADGAFNEAEHAALIDYTAAVGFDRTSAPETLRQVGAQMRRGSII